MKVLAMYLPQFHRVKENDKWWGEGFTEWTAVKNAEPLYDRHKQPKVPFKNNYYNLLDEDTMRMQSIWMHKYGVDGMCFYHYYFKDGRKILEKPAENLLKWKDINMPFCFSWANESWVRSWSNVNDGNPWSIKFDRVLPEENDTGILLEQQYGGEKEWVEHFYYLLPFFKDSRYIKYNGRPVFLIHRPDQIGCLEDMLHCWSRLSQKEKIGNLYVIGNHTSGNVEALLDGSMYQEPADTFHRFIERRYDNEYGLNRYLDYQEVWNKLLEKEVSSKNVCLGAFVGYDDTPRRGFGGIVVDKATPELFGSNMKKLFAKANALDSEYVFINAWNEWGEGMYLEPDEENGFGYLEALKEAKESWRSAVVCKDVGGYAKEDSLKQENLMLRGTVERYRSYWTVLNKWMDLCEQGITVSDILKKRRITHVAIYGIGILGKHLVTDLQKGNICIDFGIDQQGDFKKYPFKVYRMAEDLPMTELVIITIENEFNQIKEKLICKGFQNVILLSEIMNEW